MGEWLLSRRDRLIVAWHEVPGSTPPQNSRPVGYGVIRAGVRADSMIGSDEIRVRKLIPLGGVSRQNVRRVS